METMQVTVVEQKNPLMSINDIAKALGWSYNTVKAKLDLCHIEGVPDTSGEQGKNRLMLYPVTPEQLVSFAEEERLKTKLAAEKQVAKLSATAKAVAALEVVNDMSTDQLTQLGIAALQEALKRLQGEKEQLEAVNAEQAILLDDGKQWATTMRLDKEFGNKDKEERIDWYPLKAWHIAQDIEYRKVPDARYGEVNSYHRDAWMEVYGIDINNPSKDTVHEVPLQYRRKNEQKALLTLAKK